MKFNYNEIENCLEIKDDLKNRYFILKLVMVLNLINSIIRLTKLKRFEFGIEEYFWLATGFISLIALYIFVFKNSTDEKIKVANIKQLNEKKVFGQKSYSLELKNGKKRILENFKNEQELTELQALLTKIGI